MSKNNKNIPTIIIDTREQRPYQFKQYKAEDRGDKKFNIITRKLDAGDYSLDGLEFQIAIERKELNDYIKTIILDKDRFKAELIKFQTYDFKCILVEANIAEILTNDYDAHIAPAAIIGATSTLMIHWGIPVIFTGNRMAAKVICEDLLLKYWDYYQTKESSNDKETRELMDALSKISSSAARIAESVINNINNINTINTKRGRGRPRKQTDNNNQSNQGELLLPLADNNKENNK